MNQRHPHPLHNLLQIVSAEGCSIKSPISINFFQKSSRHTSVLKLITGLRLKTRKAKLICQIVQSFQQKRSTSSHEKKQTQTNFSCLISISNPTNMKQLNKAAMHCQQIKSQNKAEQCYKAAMLKDQSSKHTSCIKHNIRSKSYSSTRKKEHQ